jgi:arylsulfatase A-like enzyme
MRYVRTRVVAGAAVFCVTTAGILAILARNAPPRPNVVLIVIDALRPDHLACYGYSRELSPTIHALARRGALFRQAISQGTWTLPSVTSLFLSQYVSVHRVESVERRIADRATTLAEILRGHGYATGAFVMAGFPSAAFGMSQGFDHFRAMTGGSESMNPAIVKWLSERKRPFFLYVHYPDAHYPYRLPNPYRENYGAGYSGPADGMAPLGRLRDKLQPKDVQHLIDLYDNEISHVDFQLRTVVNALKALGLEEDTSIMLTADHGEAFLEHRKQLGHRGWPYEELVRVPLIVKGPQARAGTIVSQQVETIDLAPTILEMAGIRADANMQGHSLLPLLRGETQPASYAFSECLPLHLEAVRTERWKLIRNDESGERELYDLHEDPQERIDLAARRPALTKALGEVLLRFRQSNEALSAGREAAVANPDPKTLEQLRDLGYVQ